MDFELLNYIWIGIALTILLFLLVSRIKAPYGRHSNSHWGPLIDNKWGWFFMELPALLLMPLLALLGPSPKNVVSYLLIGLWLLHYGYRTLIFPFRLKTENKKMPLFIALSGILFNGMNGFLNGFFLGYLDPALHSWTELHVVLGLMIFLGGMYINRTSDNHLISLRKQQIGYQIPYGGFFKYISCPNHFGEIVEWFGFALIAWNLPALTFAIWTFSNLLPRALNHHQWYLEKFEEYPKDRKAVIPFIL